MLSRTALTFSVLCLAANFCFSQFSLVGEAMAIDTSCYQLTSDFDNQFGAIWSSETIDLRFDFRLTATVYFGDNNGGADGIAFALQQQSNSSGNSGSGIGIGGVAPSLIVEMYTYQNVSLGDPEDDHVAISMNGALDHSSSDALVGPQLALIDGSNVEDDTFYPVSIFWDAAERVFTFKFNCDSGTTLSYEGDIIEELFNDNPNVFWGFTAATGALSNQHIVCFETLAFDMPLVTYDICSGGQVTLTAPDGFDYLWTDIPGLSAYNIQAPLASPDTSTTYEVLLGDGCHQFSQKYQVNVVDEEVIDFSLSADTTVCVSEMFAIGEAFSNVTYTWSTGDTTATLVPAESGLYSVTLSVNNLCITEDRTSIVIVQEPVVELGADTIVCLQSGFLTIDNDFVEGSFEWNDGTDLPTLNVEEAGLYTLAVSNICGVAEGSINIDFEDCRNYYIPNIISAQSVGNNIFTVFGADDITEIVSLKIYNRWGNLVFRSTNTLADDSSTGWDGSIGTTPSTNVFVYQVELLFKDGATELITGTLTVVR